MICRRFAVVERPRTMEKGCRSRTYKIKGLPKKIAQQDFLGKRSRRRQSKQGKKPLALLRNAPCGKNRAPKKDCAARFFGKKEPQAPKQTGQETSCPVAKCALRKKQAPKKDCAARFFGKKEPQAPKQTGQETSCPVAKCALRKITGLPKKIAQQDFLGKRSRRRQSKQGKKTSCPVAKCALRRTWWSRRESNSRLTGLPKSFLTCLCRNHLTHAPSAAEGDERAEILDRPSCRLHIKTAVPRLIDARILPTGKEGADEPLSN